MWVLTSDTRECHWSRLCAISCQKFDSRSRVRFPPEQMVGWLLFIYWWIEISAPALGVGCLYFVCVSKHPQHRDSCDNRFVTTLHITILRYLLVLFFAIKSVSNSVPTETFKLTSNSNPSTLVTLIIWSLTCVITRISMFCAHTRSYIHTYLIVERKSRNLRVW